MQGLNTKSRFGNSKIYNLKRALNISANRIIPITIVKYLAVLFVLFNSLLNDIVKTSKDMT